MTAQLPPRTRYDFSWAVQYNAFGYEIESLTYHTESELYVLGTTDLEAFQLPEDDRHRDWANEGKVH